MDNSKKTRRNILKAARRVFLSQGFGGARMQEIADMAKVNKALLHYHFDSKDELFQQVLQMESERVAGIFAILRDEALPYQEKLPKFTAAMLRLSEKEPDCLPFLLQAARLYPDRIQPPLQEQLSLERFLAQVGAGMSHGFIPGKDPAALTLRLLALALLFPLAGDLLQSLLGQEACERFKEQLPGMIQGLAGAGN